MNNLFFAPARYKMAIPGTVETVNGGLIFPSGIMATALVRRNLEEKYPHLASRLLDPQLYLSGLVASSCKKVCVNLASYGWFASGDLAEFDSGAQSQSEWKREAMVTIHKKWQGAVPTSARDIESAASKCIAFQRELGCGALILPSPLTSDQSGNYSLELSWTDIGLRLAKEIAPNLHAYPTIAISDTALRGLDPYQNELLTVIIDQITARGPEGVYIVIEQSNEYGYYCSHPNTVGSLLRLVFELRRGGLKAVVVGPIGIAGLLAAAVGANIWSAGWYRGERRLRLADYTDQMGMAVPTYYVHQLASEIHLDQDLDRIVQSGFLSQIVDETPASRDLIRALRAKKSVNSVPEWQYRKSNIVAASEHFLHAAVRETAEISAKSHDECLQYAHDWIKGAEQLASKLYRVGGLNPRTELNHQAAWLRAFERFLAEADS